MVNSVDKTVHEVHQAEGVVIIDVRRPDEYAQGHIKGSINMPLGEPITAELKALMAHQIVVVHCRSGMRSQSWLEQHINDIDAQAVWHMYEGMLGWLNASLPVEISHG